MINAVQTRIRYWDILRGFAMVLVVLGHCLPIDSAFLRWIYSFHMPLFGLVSGFFFYYSATRHSAKEIIVSKFFHLAVPMIIVGIGYSFLLLNDDVSGIALVPHFVHTTLKTLWFLWALLFASYTVSLARLLGGSWEMAIYCAVIIASFLLPDSLNTSGVKFIFPFFLMGYYANMTGMVEYVKKHDIAIISALAVVYVLLFFQYSQERSIYRNGYYVFSGIYPPLTVFGNDVFRLLIGAVGSVLCALGVYQFTKVRFLEHLHSSMAVIGRYSLWVYVWHIVLCDMGWRYLNAWELLNRRQPLFGIAYSLIQLILSLALAVFTQEIVVNRVLKKKRSDVKAVS